MSAGDRDTLAERFWTKVDKSGDCWLWKASLTYDGYGQFFIKGKRWRAHRWSYTQANGEIPEGLEIDHLCRVRACVNPAHLEAVTRRENQIRGDSPFGINARKDVCIRGHEFDELDWRGRRRCGVCRREQKRAAYWRDRTTENTGTTEEG